MKAKIIVLIVVLSLGVSLYMKNASEDSRDRERPVSSSTTTIFEAKPGAKGPETDKAESAKNEESPTPVRDIARDMPKLFKDCQVSQKSSMTFSSITTQKFLEQFGVPRDSYTERWKNFSFYKNDQEYRMRIENNMKYKKPHFLVVEYSVDKEGDPIVESKKELLQEKSIQQIIEDKYIHEDSMFNSASEASFVAKDGSQGLVMTIDGVVDEVTLSNGENQTIACKGREKSLNCFCPN